MINAHSVGARAKLFVADAGEDYEANMGMLGAHNGEDLKAVHFGHVKVDDEHVEGLSIEHGQGTGASAGALDFGHAGEVLAEHLAIELRKSRIIVQQQYLGSCHISERRARTLQRQVAK